MGIGPPPFILIFRPTLRQTNIRTSRSRHKLRTSRRVPTTRKLEPTNNYYHNHQINPAHNDFHIFSDWCDEFWQVFAGFVVSVECWPSSGVYATPRCVILRVVVSSCSDIFADSWMVIISRCISCILIFAAATRLGHYIFYSVRGGRLWNSHCERWVMCSLYSFWAFWQKISPLALKKKGNLRFYKNIFTLKMKK